MERLCGRKRNKKNNNIAVPSTNLEPDINHVKVAEKEINQMAKKVSINIMHHRHRLADPGGISYKATIDGIVDAGLLPDDSANEIEEIRERQKKISAGKPEITIITIADSEAQNGQKNRG